jgi:hypothetical protein
MKEGRNTYPCQSVATPTYPSGAKLATFSKTCKNFQTFLKVNPHRSFSRIAEGNKSNMKKMITNDSVGAGGGDR